MAGVPSETTSKPESAPRRKFAVEPVETSSRSSKEDRHKQDKEQAAGRPRRRFVPQPVEESTRSSKDGTNGEHKNGSTSNGSMEKKPRKFAVQPVETVKRARRRNTGNALLPGDRTDDTPEDVRDLPRHLKPDAAPPPPVNSPFNESALGPTSPPESRFSYANLAKKTSRQSSMRRPSLDPISSVPESDESNISKPSSAATSESAHAEVYRNPKPAGPRQKNLQKESYDEVFNGYLLNMAAQQAQQQLREQAADAYPNERIHQPVDHFAADRESDSDTETGVGQLPDGPQINVQRADDKKSEAGPEASDFQKLKATMGDQKKSPQTAPKKDPFGAAFNMAGIGAEAPEPRDPEISNMREVARPPMLGGSLVFPKCPSPKMTMIDPLQRHGTRREAHIASRPQSGLWTPGSSSPVKRESPKASVCLWGGNCTAEQAERLNFPNNPQPQMGLMTPSIAPDEDPFTRWSNDEQLQGQLKKQHQLCSNPGSRVNSVLGIDQLLAMEQRIAEEYNDGFVTQIYNYLSLGYPGIARIYDDELAKISKIPVDTIRADDQRKNTKGYVSAPEGNGVDEDEVKTYCGRWKALRLYIHEWARQQPYMMMEGEGQNWGGAARRGSWFS